MILSKEYLNSRDAYDTYLSSHISNVNKAYRFLSDKIGDIFSTYSIAKANELCKNHDASKYEEPEYEAYRQYFNPTEDEVVSPENSYKNRENKGDRNKFNVGWLHHEHNNPHHWEYWVQLDEDHPGQVISLEMPDEYIIEMMCDWLSFSISKNDLNELLNWYDDHKESILIHSTTREKVEKVINKIRDLTSQGITSIDSLISESLDNSNYSKLNPKLWNDDNSLKSDIARKINDIVDEFVLELQENEIPITVLDKWIVGSNASYNYTDKSDLDIHIIADFDRSSCDTSILQILYNYFKSYFNNTYDIKIKGIPVELYIEDMNSMCKSNGIYSLEKNDWIKYPTVIEDPNVDISLPLNEVLNMYNEVLKGTSSMSAKDLVNHLYMIRKIGLMTEGEFSVGNLIFKEFRNKGYLDNLKDKIAQEKSDKLSLEGIMKIEAESKITRYMELDPKSSDFSEVKEYCDQLGITISDTRRKVKGGPNEGLNYIKLVGSKESLSNLANILWDDPEGFEEGYLDNLKNKVNDEISKELSMESKLRENKTVSELMDQLSSKVISFIKKIGYDESDFNDYCKVRVVPEPSKGRTKVEVRSDLLDYDGMDNLASELDKIVSKFDKNSYFEQDSPGIMSAYIWKVLDESFSEEEDDEEVIIYDGGSTFKVIELIDTKDVDGYELSLVSLENLRTPDNLEYAILLEGDIEWGPLDTLEEAQEWYDGVSDGYYLDNEDDEYDESSNKNSHSESKLNDYVGYGKNGDKVREFGTVAETDEKAIKYIKSMASSYNYEVYKVVRKGFSDNLLNKNYDESYMSDLALEVDELGGPEEYINQTQKRIDELIEYLNSSVFDPKYIGSEGNFNTKEELEDAKEIIEDEISDLTSKIDVVKRRLPVTESSSKVSYEELVDNAKKMMSSED